MHRRERGAVSIVHRHLDIPAGTPPEALPLDALADLLERGDLDDWGALAAAVRDDPHGDLADRILRLCRAHPMYGTSRLWPAYIGRLRSTAADGLAAPAALGELRVRRGRTQAHVAAALGISQSDVSKLERRGDVRLSTLRRYIAALGGEVDVSARFPDEDPVSISLDQGSASRAST